MCECAGGIRNPDREARTRAAQTACAAKEGIEIPDFDAAVKGKWRLSRTCPSKRVLDYRQEDNKMKCPAAHEEIHVPLDDSWLPLSEYASVQPFQANDWSRRSLWSHSLLTWLTLNG